MNYKQVFVDVWNELRKTPLFTDLAETVEASPWHREGNVLIHTQMVINRFMELWTDPLDKKMYLAALAATFHDVGKPAAEEVRESPERGVYRRYAGHEHLSAIAWLDFILKDKEVVGRLALTADDIYLIAWMIENHLPYDVKDKVKRQGLFATPHSYGATHAFTSLLRADARGRLSDDHETKLAKVEQWIADFEAIEATPHDVTSRKTAVLLIGSSSSGKSTERARIIADAAKDGVSVEVFSMDEVRLATFPSEGTALEQYNYAFDQSIGQDSAIFRAAIEKRLNEVFTVDAHMVISDNTNVSKKSRNAFIARARQKGYQVATVLMLTHPSVAKRRQDERQDRDGVPIWQQFNAMTVPTVYSESDFIVPVLSWNE